MSAISVDLTKCLYLPHIWSAFNELYAERENQLQTMRVGSAPMHAKQ